MSASSHAAHHFDCRLVWTGAEKGGTTRYDSYSRETRIEIEIEIEGKPPLPVSAAPPFLGDPALHERAHALCFIASSVNFEVRHEAVITAAEAP